MPADRNWLKALIVGELLVEVLARMDSRFPEAEEGLEGLVVS